MQHDTYTDEFEGVKLSLQTKQFFILVDFVSVCNKVESILEMSVRFYDQCLQRNAKLISFIKPEQRLAREEEQRLGICNEDLERAPSFKGFIGQIENHPTIVELTRNCQRPIVVFTQKQKRFIFKEQYESRIGSLHSAWKLTVYLDDFFFFDCFQTQKNMQIDTEFNLVALYNKHNPKALRRKLDASSSLYSVDLMEQVLRQLTQKKGTEMSLYSYRKAEEGEMEVQKQVPLLKSEQLRRMQESKQRSAEQQLKYNQNVNRIEQNHMPKQLTIFEDLNEQQDAFEQGSQGSQGSHDFDYLLIIHPIVQNSGPYLFVVLLFLYDVRTQHTRKQLYFRIQGNYWDYAQSIQHDIDSIDCDVRHLTHNQPFSLALFNLKQSYINDFLDVMSHFRLPHFFDHYIPIQRCWSEAFHLTALDRFNDIVLKLKITHYQYYTDKLLEIIRHIQNQLYLWKKSQQERLFLHF